MKKILVVEDDTATCMLLKQILSREDTLVDLANDAMEAWELLPKHHYDLFIVDLNLPFGANGFEFISRIRSIPDYKETPAVAMTAYIGIFDQTECLKKGFNYYIAKPFDINSFQKQIRKILEKQ